MKKIVTILLALVISAMAMAQSVDTLRLDAVSVVSFYTTTENAGSIVESETLVKTNYGQEPSHLFKSMPSIIALSDNGTEFGYGYYRIRGLDQTRINVMLDGCPWNEAEDFGAYFANSPDLMSSMHTIKVERGTSASYNGVAGSAGGISLESVDLKKDTTSYFYAGAGSYGSFKTSVVYNSGVNERGWGFHIRATQSQTDGFRDNSYNNSQALTFKVGKYFNERHSLDFLSMTGYHRNSQGWIGNSLAELEINPRANGNTADETDNWFMTMNRLQYKGWLSDNIVLTSSVYFQAQNGAYRMDLDNYMRRMSDPTWETTNMLYDYGLTHYMIGSNTAAKFYLNKATIVTGINAYTYNRRHFLGDGSVNIDEDYDNVGIKNDASAFVTGTYKITGRWGVTGNLQYRHVGFHYIDKLNPLGENYTFDKPWDFLNWGISSEYTPCNEVKTYLRYAMTHREPTRSDMFGGNEWYLGDLVTTTPEIANDVEAGLVLALNKLTVNLNAYHMWFRNELILNGEYGPNGLPCHESAKDSHRTGLELTLDWEMFKNFHFINNSSYSGNVFDSETFGNKNHILTPAITVNQDIVYSTDTWEVGTNFNYRSKMYVDMANEHELPCNWTLNVHASKRFGNFEVGVRANNLTNRVNYCTGAVNEIGETLYFREAGFNFLANMKIYF